MLIWLFGILRICVGCIGLSEDWLFAKQTLKFVYVKPINIIDIDSVYIYIFILCILSVFNNPSWLGWLIKIQPTAFCKQKPDLKFQSLVYFSLNFQGIHNFGHGVRQSRNYKSKQSQKYLVLVLLCSQVFKARLAIRVSSLKCPCECPLSVVNVLSSSQYCS